MTIVDDLLDKVIKPEFSDPVPICTDYTADEESCYNPAGPYRHISQRDWSGTLRVLTLCLAAQVAVSALAVIWDVTRYLIWRLRKKGKWIEQSEKYTYVSMIFDTMDVAMSIACCITFVLRSYASFADGNYSDHRQQVADIIDFVASGLFGVRFIDGWLRANSRMAYTLRFQALLDVFTITSGIAVPLLENTWLPFTFLRPISMTQALSRLLRVTDLPELYEQLALTLAEFFSMVFTFAGIIFIIENLGNPPGWYDGEDQNFSFMSAIWFVTVTVSTVGYGDFYPTSILGRVAGVFFIVIGVIFFGSKTSAIASLMAAAANGQGRYSSGRKRHVLLTGHLHTESLNDFSVEFFHPEHAGQSKADYPVCILSKRIINLEPLRVSQAIPYHKLQQLTGSVLKPPDLDRCKIHSAKACFLLGDALAHSPEHHDRELLLRALAVKRMSPKIEIYLQLLRAASLPLAIDMTAVAMSTIKCGLLAKTAVCPGIIPLIGNLLRSIDAKSVKKYSKKKSALQIQPEYLQGMQSEIYRCTIPDNLKGKRFGDLVEEVYRFRNKGLLLFALSADALPGASGSSRSLCDPPPSSPATPAVPNARGAGGKSDTKMVFLHPGKDHVVYEPYCMVIADDDPQNQLNRIGGGFVGALVNNSIIGLRKRTSLTNVAGNVVVPTHGEGFGLPPSPILVSVHGGDEGMHIHPAAAASSEEEGESGEEEEAAGGGGAGAEGLGSEGRGRVAAVSGAMFGADGEDHRGGEVRLPGALGLVTSNAELGARGVHLNGSLDSSAEHGHGHGHGHGHASPESMKRVGAGVKPLPPVLEGMKKKRRKLKEDGTPMRRKKDKDAKQEGGGGESEVQPEADVEEAKPKTPTSGLPSHERSVMMTKLEPPMARFDPSTFGTRHATLGDHVDLVKHIVVCGFPVNVGDFLRPIKAAARGGRRVTILFVTEEEPSDDQLGQIFPGHEPIHNPWSTLHIHLLNLPPLNPASMRRANVGKADSVLLLAERSMVEAEEPGLMDAAVVFAHRYMMQNYPGVKANVASELRWDESVGFLDDAIREDGAVAPLYLQPSFAEGSVYSAAMSTSMLVQAYYNPHLLSIVGKLLSSRITNDESEAHTHGKALEPPGAARTHSVAAAEVEMEQEDVDPSLEDKTYKDLLVFYMAKDLLPMGLYRRDPVTSRWYTFTNPTPEKVVRRDDKVFVLARRDPVH